MSRARPLHLPDDLHPLFEEDQAFDGKRYWLDVSRNGELASSRQLELLSAVEDVDLDDLLDSVVTQGEVVKRLREALGQGPVPPEVLERQRAWREARKAQPECRNCRKIGNSTRHHFVPKWLLKELEAYQQRWSDRSRNCIPLCTDCHKGLHQRDDVEKSIVELLSANERTFVDAALSELANEHPKLLLLLARGDGEVYETRLIRDWIEGRFRSC